jgi:hypothetical protein
VIRFQSSEAVADCTQLDERTCVSSPQSNLNKTLSTCPFFSRNSPCAIFGSRPLQPKIAKMRDRCLLIDLSVPLRDRRRPRLPVKVGGDRRNGLAWCIQMSITHCQSQWTHLDRESTDSVGPILRHNIGACVIADMDARNAFECNRLSGGFLVWSLLFTFVKQGASTVR